MYKVPFQRLLGSLFVYFQEIKILLPPRTRINIISNPRQTRWWDCTVEADRRWARFFQAASKIVVSFDFPREPRPHPSPSTQRRSPIGGCFQALTKRSPSSATRGCDKKCRFSVSSSSRARLLRLLDRRPLAKSRVPDKTLRGIEPRHSWPSFYLVRSFVRVSLVRLLRTVDGSTARGGLIMEA